MWNLHLYRGSERCEEEINIVESIIYAKIDYFKASNMLLKLEWDQWDEIILFIQSKL